MYFSIYFDTQGYLVWAKLLLCHSA